MAVKKQPNPDAGKLHEVADDWFRQFLKHLELFMVETGQGLGPDVDGLDCSLAAIQAVKLTLLDSGLNSEQVTELFGRVALESVRPTQERKWNADLNTRRFDLIDRDIQGTISPIEQLELAGLTQLMRASVDSELNLPIANISVLCPGAPRRSIRPKSGKRYAPSKRSVT